MSAERGKSGSEGAFRVSGARAFANALVHEHPATWVALGNLETRVLGGRLDGVRIERPTYIAGLARSGSTILLELLHSLPCVVTHRYRDFPPIFTPWWWNWFLDRAARGDVQPTERAHKDRIKVTPDSPEAMEEALWMAFFAHLHDPRVSNVLGADDTNLAFDRFYVDHVRKLLALRAGTRYASKGNYNVARLAYLQRLFPDARFVVPVREPGAHIASLMKQHRLFCSALDGNERGRKHLRHVGHFEFGPDRCPINTGPGGRTAEIEQLWASGEEVRGWARYWSSIYGFVLDAIQADAALSAACRVVRYEDLCGSPAASIEQILAHCELEAPPATIAAFADRLSLPDYYRWPFCDEDTAVIREETADVAARLGY